MDSSLSHVIGRGRFLVALVLLPLASPLLAMTDPGDAGPADSTVSMSTGAAVSSVPIAVPPGPGGFQPELVLQYSSRSGDGYLGVGWSLPLPEVHCSSRFGVPDFANCEHYEYGGQLLIEEGTEAIPGHASAPRFHTFVESFQRITFQAGNYWIVEQPDGTKLYFGESSTHRIEQGGGTARWLLERAVNVHGTEIWYTYDTTDPGTALPNAITYGSGSAATTVGFVYGLRDDPRLIFTGGLERHLERRLEEVHVLSNGVYRRYLLGYDSPVAYTAERTRLSWVQEFGTECTLGKDPVTECTGLPKRIFEYTNADPSSGFYESDYYRIPFGSYPSWSWNYSFPLGATSYPQLFGDLNGDGLVDRIQFQFFSPIRPSVETINSWEEPGFRIMINDGNQFTPEFTSSGEYTPPVDQIPEVQALTDSFKSLTYQQPYFEFEQIVTQDVPPESAAASFFPLVANCQITLKTRTAKVYEEFFLRGLSSEVSEWDDVYYSQTFPVTGFVQPRPRISMVDVDSDGLADIVLSTRLSGAKRHFDCNDPDTPLANPDELPAQQVTVVFRNTGDGWVQDDTLATGLPPFEELIFKSFYQTAKEEPPAGLMPGSSQLSPCGNMSVRGLEEYSVDPRDSVCNTFIDLAPRFVDFNGDGYVDLAVLVRDFPDRLLTGPRSQYQSTDAPDDNLARTRVWVQKPGDVTGDRWQRAPEYDLPNGALPVQYKSPGLAHAALFHDEIGLPGYAGGSDVVCYTTQDYYRDCGGPNTYTTDFGLRFVDLNADGLPDVVWSNGASSAVWLNTGTGNGQSFAAWCRSGSEGNGYVAAECPEAARYLPPRPIAEYFNAGRASTGKLEQAAVFADLNGDGFSDFVQLRTLDPNFDTATWIHSPGEAGSAWVRDQQFDLPIDFLGRTARHPGGPHPHGTCPDCQITDYYPQFQVIDINGDGADDVVGDIHAFLGFANSDLLGSIDNGRGGLVEIAYTSARVNHVLEDLHDENPLEGAVPGPGPLESVLWRPVPVVWRVEVTGPNIAKDAAGKTTQRTLYAYGHPQFCQVYRSDLGFGIVQVTRADSSTVESYFYQDHGRAGRVGKRLTLDGGVVVSRYEASWELVDGWIAGKPASTHLGRMVWEEASNEYSGTSGAVVRRWFDYDDAHGYNFVKTVTTERPSGNMVVVRAPASGAFEADWILRRVGSEYLLDTDLVWAGQTDYEYTAEGRLFREDRHRDGGIDGTEYGYDTFGNRTSVTDANGNATLFEFDASGSSLVRRTDPAVGTNPAIETEFIPHGVFRVTQEVIPGYVDEPWLYTNFDEFGRVKETWARLRDTGELVKLSERVYEDVSLPLYVEERRFATATDTDPTVAVVVDDGFGGVWKEITETERVGAGSRGRAATATFRFPATRTSRTTNLIACGSGDPVCDGVTGEAETPAVVMTADALGRPVAESTPRGLSEWYYFASEEAIITAPGTTGLYFVDGVLSLNAKGDMTRRSLDGDRLVAVEECYNEPPPSDLSQASCAARAGQPNRTLYGYHATGNLEVIYDPIGAGSLGDPDHHLRYHFDEVGQVVAIDDPDAGTSSTSYDGVGNVLSTTNARGQVRSYVYDELDRPTTLTTPEGPVTFTYQPDQLKLYEEHGPGYSTRQVYDGLGRLFRHSMNSVFADTWRDLLGRPQWVKTHAGPVTAYEYDGPLLRRVCSDAEVGSSCDESLPEARDIISDVQYDGLGRRKTMVLGNVTTRSFSYEDEQAGGGNLNRGLWKDEVTGLDPVSHVISGRDAIGNVVGWSTTSTEPALTTSGTIDYDRRNRIASWDHGQTTAHLFDYDALGNLSLHAGEEQTFGGTDAGPHAVSARAGRSYAYEGGNLASALGGGEADRYYKFDSADRLVCVSSSPAETCNVLKVWYDAAGNRVREETADTVREFLGHHHVFEDNPSTLGIKRSEITAFGEVVATVVSDRVQASVWPAYPQETPPWLYAVLIGLAPGLAACLLALALRGGLVVGVARRPGMASVSAVAIVVLVSPHHAMGGGGGNTERSYRWVMSDALGSSVAVFDDQGMLLHQTRYAPFGAVDAEYDSSDPYRRNVYAGHPTQEETGLVYMRARWMDPTTGTFLSVDPVVPAYDDPQSLNAYAYARNNPITYDDPTGMCVIMSHCVTTVPTFTQVGGHQVSARSFTMQLVSDATGDVVSQTSTTDFSVNGSFIGTAPGIVSAAQLVAALQGETASGAEQQAPAGSFGLANTGIDPGSVTDVGETLEGRTFMAAMAAGAPIGPSGDELTQAARQRGLRGGVGIIVSVLLQEAAARQGPGRARGFTRTLSALVRAYGGATLVYSGGTYIALGIGEISTGAGAVPGIATAAFGGGLVVYGGWEFNTAIGELGPAFREFTGSQ